MLKLISVYTAVALLSVCGTALFGASPVVMLSSAGPVRVSGTDLAADTVSLWPLVNGDRIEALASPVVVILPNQSRVTIHSGAVARVEVNGQSVAVRLISDAGQSKPGNSEGDNTRMIQLGRPISPRTPVVTGDPDGRRLPGIRHN